MKALILSCNTGQGHNEAGLAIQEGLLERGIDCEFADTLRFAGEGVSRKASGLYVGTTIHAPAVFGGLYWIADHIGNPRLHSPVYWLNRLYRDRLLEHVEKSGADVVVAPHLFPAQTLTSLRAEGRLTVPAVAVATDYTSIPFWEETRMDAFVIPHPDLTEEFIKKGLDPAVLYPLGIPVRKAFSDRTDPAAARKRLGLPPDVPTVLIMSGSMGYGHLEQLIRRMRERGGPTVHMVVMGGNNEPLKARLRQLFGADPGVRVLDFTREVPLYMDACDLLFSKPGGLTSTEAAVKNLPLIHTAPIPGCETKNALFFAARGLSVYPTRPEDQVEAALALLLSRSKRERMRKAQRTAIPADARDRICDLIIRLAAAGSRTLS